MDIDALMRNYQAQNFGSMKPNTPQPGVMGAQAPKPKKNFLLDQISTVGGIVGGVAGGLGGGAITGGLGAVPGAAVGAGAGSALGETLENILTGDAWNKNVGKEAALGAVFGGGPLRLAKTAMGAKAALSSAKQEGTELGLKGAIRQGSDEAAKWSATGAVGRKLTGKSTELATKQFGLTGNYINKFKGKYKEDPGKTVLRYGFSTIDDVEGNLAKQNEVFSSLVSNASPIKKSDLQTELNKIADDLLTQAPSGQQAVGQKVLAEMEQLLGQFGDEIPAAALNKAKRQYDSLVNYTRQTADPATYDVNKRVADTMRGLIQKASGSNQLKETGMEISKLIDLQEEIGKRAGTVANRNSSPLGFRNLLGGGIGAGAGFGAGGVPGALMGAATVAAVNSPTGRRLATQGAIKGGETLSKIGSMTGPLQDTAMGTAGRIGGYNSLRGSSEDGVNNSSAMTLEDAMLNQSMSAGNMNNMSTPTNPAMSNDPMSANMSQPYQQTPQSSSPYSKENLLADIQRDPTNAKDYIDYYQQLDEIFGAQSTEPDYNSTTASSLAMSANGVSTLDQLEQLYSGTGGGSGKLMGAAQNVLGNAGFNDNTASYNALANSSVSQLAKAINGGGQVSDADAAVIISALPKVTDSPEVARTKFAALKQRLENARQNTMMYNGGATQQPTTLDEIYATQQGAY